MTQFMKLLLAGTITGMVMPTAAIGTAAAAGPENRITILYDAFGKALRCERTGATGGSVEIAGKRILFDTGDDRDIFAANVKAKNVDLTKLDFVVLSHRHGDHMAGLAHVLSVNPTARVKSTRPRRASASTARRCRRASYRKAEALPPDMRYFDGKPPEVMTFGSAWQGANFELIDKTTEILPGITLIALLSELRDRGAQGALTGHRTRRMELLWWSVAPPTGSRAKIVEAAATINPKIHLIAGGFYRLFVAAQDDAISKIVAVLKDTFQSGDHRAQVKYW